MWKYEQSTGDLYNPEGVKVATGYAGGNCGRNPEGVNNPDLQGVRSVGPLPVGKYKIGVPLMQSHLGPLAIPLTPHLDNDMLGRSGFYIHGDTAALNHSASEGCIIIPRAIRMAVITSNDQILEVMRG